MEQLTELKSARVTMRRSKKIDSLAKALSAAQNEFAPVPKSGYDVEHSRSYSEMGDLNKATRAALAKYGLAVLQLPSTNVHEKTVTVTTILLHESGECIESDLEVPAHEVDGDVVIFDAQSIGRAITLARRYSYSAILQLASESDIKPIEDMATLRNESPRVNPAQANSFWLKAQSSGKSREQCNGYLKSIGLDRTESMTQVQFPAAMRWAEASDDIGRIVDRKPGQ